jgi:hypothetical protein
MVPEIRQIAISLPIGHLVSPVGLPITCLLDHLVNEPFLRPIEDATYRGSIVREDYLLLD